MLLTTEEIRNKWLNFFKTKDHFELPFCSLVPIDDESLLWINSGVSTLKLYFEGKKNPPSQRLVNCQKSIRTNDIQNVGFTTRHHTLFEMLGNFSIGDYFKKEAISYAWEFLTSTKWLNIDKNKLYITVYNEDIIAHNIWLNEIKIEPEKLIKCNKERNFWEIGKGPSGPNTEIFYDRGIKYDSSKIGLKLLKDDIENDRYIEIWNIVFSEFNSDGNGKYLPLPRKNIDTGAGLERLATILQDVPTNFDNDLFQKIIKEIIKLTNSKFVYKSENYFIKNKNQEKINTNFKIISDHIRAIVFTIADGVYPSNKNRGYIIRRLIRRSMIYGRKIDINEPFLYKLVDILIISMGKYYNYLKIEKNRIKEIIFAEENKFLKTLIQGEEQLMFFIKKNKSLTNEQVFMLFESFGFPFELTQEICLEYNIKINIIEFEKLLENHKKIAKINQKKVISISKQNKFLINLNANSLFVGYDLTTTNNSKITHIFNNDKLLNEINKGNCFLILDKTPFYAEKGGQISDLGIIKNKDFICEVLDVQSGINNEHIHYVNIISGTIKTNSIVQAIIEEDRRMLIMKNHSGTHLIHSAIRNVLGNKAKQTGSYNDDKYLRIDISFDKKITPLQIKKINELCLKKIQEKINCEIINCSYDFAINNLNALAFFKDKYDLTKKVRVIKFSNFSVELCGGTHVKNSKQIESLLITKCNSVGNNTYRFISITSNITINKYLFELKENLTKLLNSVNELNIKLNNEKKIIKFDTKMNVFDQHYYLIDNINILESLKKILKNKLQNKIIDNKINQFNNLKPTNFKNDIQIIKNSFNNIDEKIINKLIDFYRNKYNKKTIILFNNIINNNRGIIYLSISEDLKIIYHSGKIIKIISEKFFGKGGGNSIKAQLGYSINVNKVKEFIENNLEGLF